VNLLPDIFFQSLESSHLNFIIYSINNQNRRFQAFFLFLLDNKLKNYLPILDNSLFQKVYLHDSLIIAISNFVKFEEEYFFKSFIWNLKPSFYFPKTIKFNHGLISLNQNFEKEYFQGKRVFCLFRRLSCACHSKRTWLLKCNLHNAPCCTAYAKSKVLTPSLCFTVAPCSSNSSKSYWRVYICICNVEPPLLYVFRRFLLFANESKLRALHGRCGMKWVTFYTRKSNYLDLLMIVLFGVLACW